MTKTDVIRAIGNTVAFADGELEVLSRMTLRELVVVLRMLERV